jgi:hypothetical protein
MMDQGVSNEAIEGLKDQKAIKVVMDRQQAMDQGIRYGSKINREAMDQGAMMGAMDSHAMDQEIRYGYHQF